MQKIALMGLGIMGSGMARNLVEAGYPLAIYNRSRARAEPFAELGARITDTPREAAEGADIVLSMVADDTASRSVWLGEKGALAGAPRGALLVECSTLTVDWIRELGELAARQGCELLDAPVTGSKPQAAAGQLVFLVGGSAAALERARPVLKVMSREIVHVGPSGSGSLIKLINNFLCGVQTASFAQALALVERGGLDRDRAIEILLGGAPGSPIVKMVASRMMAHDLTPNFALELMMKDLTYAEGVGERAGVPLTTATAARQLFQSAADAGFAEADLSAVIEPLRRAGPPGMGAR